MTGVIAIEMIGAIEIEGIITGIGDTIGGIGDMIGDTIGGIENTIGGIGDTITDGVGGDEIGEMIASAIK